MKIFYSNKESLHKPKFEWNFGKKVPYPDKYTREQVVTEALFNKGYEEIMSQPKSFDIDHLYAVHTEELVDHIKNCEKRLKEGEELYPHIFPYREFEPQNDIDPFLAGYHCFDVGTYLQKYTYQAAKSAVDCALNGAELILKNQENRVFAVCRPPGHHAAANYYGGYCFFNNAAVAAFYLSKSGRTTILDLDFHHGNGTQSIFYEQAQVVYISIHGDPRTNYPYFSGFANEKGLRLGHGYNINIPLEEGVGNKEYDGYLKNALSKLKEFNSQYLILSMGFDIFEKDDMGSFNITADYFYEIGKIMNNLDIPVLVCLEGGYQIDNLGQNAVNFVEGFY
ncbi:MAG: histone deacetylase family protein [Fidelibacterota bacterium]